MERACAYHCPASEQLCCSRQLHVCLQGTGLAGHMGLPRLATGVFAGAEADEWGGLTPQLIGLLQVRCLVQCPGLQRNLSAFRG